LRVAPPDDAALVVFECQRGEELFRRRAFAPVYIRRERQIGTE
jgi:hypothetical protein